MQYNCKNQGGPIDPPPPPFRDSRRPVLDGLMLTRHEWRNLCKGSKLHVPEVNSSLWRRRGVKYIMYKQRTPIFSSTTEIFSGRGLLGVYRNLLLRSFSSPVLPLKINGIFAYYNETIQTSIFKLKLIYDKYFRKILNTEIVDSPTVICHILMRNRILLDRVIASKFLLSLSVYHNLVHERMHILLLWTHNKASRAVL